jgi:DNA-binding MarR family transcriptional regulator
VNAAKSTDQVDGRDGSSPGIANTADALGRLLGPLRRTVLRRARESGGLPDLPDAQVELLRVLQVAPGTGVGEVAARLRVAPSTVSNVVRSAVAAGLVERRTSSTDLRAVELYPSASALGLLETYDGASGALLSNALAVLAPADREAIERAMPALIRLLDAIDDAGRRGRHAAGDAGPRID